MAKNDSKQILEAKIALLTKARNYIKCGREYAICHAINSARNYYFMHRSKKFCSISRERASALLNSYIRVAINQNTFYTGWVFDVIGEDSYYNTTPFHKRNKLAKQGRLAWIDWMIGCLNEDLARLSSTPISQGNSFALAA